MGGRLAPAYAPEVNGTLVGAAQGGITVSPEHNLNYINGSLLWSSAIPAALLGISRGYHVDLNLYLSDYGKTIINYTQNQCLAVLLGHWPGLTYQKLFKPQFQNITTVPIFTSVLNDLIMSTHGTPTIPLLMTQGTGGALEGTDGTQPGIGAGDGVMITGDARTLARRYCHRGVRVQYIQHNGIDHAAGIPIFMTQAQTWLAQRFASKTPPSSCGSIPPGNSLDPLR